MNNWICCQIGAREHYAIPRALHHHQQLKFLLTDVWLPSNSRFNLLPQPLLSNFRQRYHAELDTALVKSFNYQTVAWELQHKFSQIKPWDKIIARNSWWQQQVIRRLEKVKISNTRITIFAYSYGALEIFKYAQKRGWKVILGQIDPGIIEEKLIFKLTQKHSIFSLNNPTAPLKYWSNWRQECSLADHIIVNSKWSKQALQQTGISEQKIKTIPLAYSAPPLKFSRTYPDRFTTQRPLKVLFLGQIIIRKGIAEILEAIALLNNSPLEFWFVGKVKINLPQKIKHHPQIKWWGSVDRNQTKKYYQKADIFLFPTHSDGFGLTQLEAQAWQLPIIASQFCGAVVQDRINGLILPQVTGKTIAKAMTFCLNNPQELTKFSQKSTQVIAKLNLNKLAQEIIAINNT